MRIDVNIVGRNFCNPKTESKVNDFLLLRKEPDNKYDKDAIAVYNTTNEKIGYVSNSYHTVASDCKTASRIYELVPDIFTAIIYQADNYYIKATILMD